MEERTCTLTQSPFPCVVAALLRSYVDVMKREMGERPELPACFNED